MVRKYSGYSVAKDCICSDFPMNGETHIPMYGGPSRRPQGTIHNNVEVKIAPTQKRSFLTKIIYSILLLQSVGSTILIGILYIRIVKLEMETKQFNGVTSNSIAELMEFRQQISDERDIWRDARTLKSNLNVINATAKSGTPYRVEMIKDKDYVEKKNKSGDLKEIQGNGELQHDNDLGESMEEIDEKMIMSDPKRKIISSASIAPDSVIHFKGVHREIHINNKTKGTIGPWYIDDTTPNSTELTDFSLDFEKSSVRVNTKGYFFVYAQVFYQSPNGSCSFALVKTRITRNEDDKDEILAICSSGVSCVAGQEVSCYTATMVKLEPGYSLRIVQRERDRHILLSQSYFGMMKISPTLHYPSE